MTPTQISFQGMHPSTSIEEDVHERMKWLGTYDATILGGHVAIQVPHRHQRQGRVCRVTIRLSVPGDDVIVNHQELLAPVAGEPRDSARLAPQSHDGVRAAVRAAFAVARRQLEDDIRRKREAARRLTG